MKAFLATVLLMAAPAAFAQTFQAAPPLAQVRTDVFDWREVPQGQMVPVRQATFDSSGYLLTDENGQLISVPFSGNLYTMQFGKTSGGMYFVNDGNSTPTLYIPENGFLENAAVSGARWYPFPQRYFYTRPVYLGPAPSWDAYYGMGWYPGMTIYGGYWGYQPWRTGIVYSPMSCLTISVGTRICRDWDDFCLFGRNYTTVRPIIIRDTRPIFIEQRERWDRSRSNDKSWDRDRPTYRESSRPGFQAPARHSEERAQGQGQGGSDRFNYGSTPSYGGTPSNGGRATGGSREVLQTRPGSTVTSSGNLNPGGSREREFIRPNTSPSVPNMTPVRPSGGYSVPTMTPVRPGGGAPSFPSGGSRERELGRSSDAGRSFEPARTRTFEPSRESRGSDSRGSSSPRSSSSPSRESQPSRARETRK
jgi:hypothetical protein